VTSPQQDPFGHNPFGDSPFGGVPFGGAPAGPPVFTTPPEPPDQRPVNIFATLSVVFAFVFAPAGAILGHLGLRQVRRNGQRGRDRAVVGMVLSYSVITVTVVALAVWATRADTTPAKITAPTTTKAITTTTTTAPPPAPPTVAPADLAGLLPSLDDFKNITGDQNLVALAPTFEPSHDPTEPTPDRPECWETFGGGAPNIYDMEAVVGYYSSVMNDGRDVRTAKQAAEVLLAFRDAAAAQRQLASLLSLWRQCGSTMTLIPPPGSKQKPVAVSISVPADAGNGITTMEAIAQGPVLRSRVDRAIAAKNNVVVDADVLMINSDRGQQAVLDITNHILGRIPG
jgi:eukaryotic-like serine/threonine-protein kinase